MGQTKSLADDKLRGSEGVNAEIPTKREVTIANKGETGSERSSRVFRGDRLQIHLLRLEEKCRSRVLYDQLNAFEEKVYLSSDQFHVDVFYRMFVKLTKRTVVDVRKVKTIGHLRKCFADLQNVIKCKLLHRHLAKTKEEDILVRYFTWFFQFVDYLRELRDNFVARIYTALFRYFYHAGFDSPDREDTVDSGVSGPSLLLARSFSIDSGYSELTRQTPMLIDEEQLLHSARSRSEFEETQAARQNHVTRNALFLLGKQFQDIKSLYDNSEIEQLAKRLCHLKERTDYLLNVETSLDKDLLCQDSERYVFHLKLKDIGTENIMRFVPDILLKQQKAVWLARRWLEKDDKKTKDLNAKLDKLTALETEMNKRLKNLAQEIEQQEQELESKSNILNSLLRREDRSTDLSHSIYNMQEQSKTMSQQLKQLNEERKDLCCKMTKAAKENDKKTYKELLPLYQRNKLKRFALERRLATVDFHLSLHESDMTMEMEVKPSLMYNTNDAQDKCEEIEQWLEKAKKEKNAIQTVLDPIRKDKLTVQEQIVRKEKLIASKSTPRVNAEYVSTLHNDVVDLNAEFLGRSDVGDPFSIFMTSLPEDNTATPIQTPIKTIDTSNSRRSELVAASEW